MSKIWLSQKLEKDLLSIFAEKNCFFSLLTRVNVRVEKSCKYVQALAYLTNSPIKTPFPIFLGMLLFKNGKLTIGKSNESLLSYIEVDMKPSFITILRSKKCVDLPSPSSGTKTSSWSGSS